MSIPGRFKHTLRHKFFDKFPADQIPATPHFDPPSTQFFLEKIGRTHRYFEFGGGGSTIYSTALGIPTYTVESSPGFIRALKQRIGSNDKWHIHFADIGPVGAWGKPIYQDISENVIKRWARYPLDIFDDKSFPTKFPDFVLIDGRFRVACFLSTLMFAKSLRAKDLTIMFDDYYDKGRESYHKVEKFVGQPRKVGRSGVFILNIEELLAPTLGDVMSAVSDFN